MAVTSIDQQVSNFAEELRKSVLIQKESLQKLLNLSETITQNHSDYLLHSEADISKLCRHFLDSGVVISILGEVNAGKSSFITALFRLAEDVYLPINDEPCTARITKLKCSDEELRDTIQQIKINGNVELKDKFNRRVNKKTLGGRLPARQHSTNSQDSKDYSIPEFCDYQEEYTGKLTWTENSKKDIELCLKNRIVEENMMSIMEICLASNKILQRNVTIYDFPGYGENMTMDYFTTAVLPHLKPSLCIYLFDKMLQDKDLNRIDIIKKTLQNYNGIVEHFIQFILVSTKDDEDENACKYDRNPAEKLNYEEAVNKLVKKTFQNATFLTGGKKEKLPIHSISSELQLEANMSNSTEQSFQDLENSLCRKIKTIPRELAAEMSSLIRIGKSELEEKLELIELWFELKSLIICCQYLELIHNLPDSAVSIYENEGYQTFCIPVRKLHVTLIHRTRLDELKFKKELLRIYSERMGSKRHNVYITDHKDVIYVFQENMPSQRVMSNLNNLLKNEILTMSQQLVQNYMRSSSQKTDENIEAKNCVKDKEDISGMMVDSREDAKCKDKEKKDEEEDEEDDKHQEEDEEEDEENNDDDDDDENQEGGNNGEDNQDDDIQEHDNNDEDQDDYNDEDQDDDNDEDQDDDNDEDQDDYNDEDNDGENNEEDKEEDGQDDGDDDTENESDNQSDSDDDNNDDDNHGGQCHKFCDELPIRSNSSSMNIRPDTIYFDRNGDTKFGNCIPNSNGLHLIMGDKSRCTPFHEWHRSEMEQNVTDEDKDETEANNLRNLGWVLWTLNEGSGTACPEAHGNEDEWIDQMQNGRLGQAPSSLVTIIKLGWSSTRDNWKENRAKIEGEMKDNNWSSKSDSTGLNRFSSSISDHSSIKTRSFNRDSGIGTNRESTTIGIGSGLPSSRVSLESGVDVNEITGSRPELFDRRMYPDTINEYPTRRRSSLPSWLYKSVLQTPGSEISFDEMSEHEIITRFSYTQDKRNLIGQHISHFRHRGPVQSVASNGSWQIDLPVLNRDRWEKIFQQNAAKICSTYLLLPDELSGLIVNLEISVITEKAKRYINFELIAPNIAENRDSKVLPLKVNLKIKMLFPNGKLCESDQHTFELTKLGSPANPNDLLILLDDELYCQCHRPDITVWFL